MTEPKPSYDAGGEQPDAKTVLENTRVLREQLRAGEVRFVDGKRYRDTLCIVWDALAASQARVEALELALTRGCGESAHIAGLAETLTDNVLKPEIALRADALTERLEAALAAREVKP
jgi:hypothetical protein